MMRILSLLVWCFAALTAAWPQSAPGPAPARPPVQPQAAAAPRWKLQYFYDEVKSHLAIVDLQFPSARRGVALGVLSEQHSGAGRTHPKGVALATSDGGEHWTLEMLGALPVSSFFLNDSLGWMAAVDGIWRTDEGGRTWKKIWSQRDVFRVWFQDEQRGWAIGAPKKAWQTTDGGKHWTMLPVIAKVQSREDSTAFNWIWFDGDRGMIVGDSRPPRRIRAAVPLWADPEDPRRNREWPALTILLQTTDGGKNWMIDSGSVFGRMSRVRSAPGGVWLGLVEYREGMEYPSEIYALNSSSKVAGGAIYRSKDRQVTDFWVTGGEAYLGAIEVPGKLGYSPVPGKVRILRSSDLKLWEEMKVDYRAVAHEVVLAGSPDRQMWAGTDTGMILHLADR